MPEVNDNLVWFLAGVFAALLAGSIGRLVALRHADPHLAAQRRSSLKVWWVLMCLVTAAVVTGRSGAALLLAIAGFLGLQEFLNLPGPQTVDRWMKFVACACVPLQYACIVTGQDIAAQTILPVAALLALSTVRLVRGDTKDFVRLTAGVYWGVMILVYGLSHAALLYSVGVAHESRVGPGGWFLFLLIVTEMDDIAQAVVGRRIGRHPITPAVSPHKTWEGFCGGIVVSVFLSLLLAPWLTTFPSATTPKGLLLTVGAGLLLVITAFLGDINMSAVKRDAGVKDGSSILPGMGGIIDRVDSLTFTAPAFFWFLRIVL